jgi:hypothetical protein
MAQEGEVSVWTQVGGLFLGALSLVSGAIYWALDRLLRERVNEAKVEMRQHIDNEVRNFGETGAALRQALTEAQFWNRDNFVRKDEFRMAVDQINQNVKTIDSKIDQLRDSVDEKLDRLLSRGP